MIAIRFRLLLAAVILFAVPAVLCGAGYSVRTLDWLLSWHGLERIHADPDTLCRLADEQTRRWAAWEERSLKLLALAAARLQGLRPGSSLSLAPWLDAYYRAA